MAREAPVNNFQGRLVAEQLEDGYHWMIAESFTYRLGDPNGIAYVRVPVGFVTDFASIPRGLWNIWPPAAGKHSKPAVIHDVLYQRGYVEHERHRTPISRKDADDIFKEALEVAGVGWLSRQLIYAGVRVGGAKAWTQYREADHVEQAG